MPQAELQQKKTVPTQVDSLDSRIVESLYQDIDQKKYPFKGEPQNIVKYTLYIYKT